MGDVYRIVVGIDFGATGQEALRKAIALGRVIPNAELHLAHVVVDPDPSTAEQLAQDERKLGDAVASLREIIDREVAGTEGTWFEREVVQHVRIGDAAEALHQVAVDVNADLIVVGTHGHRGIAKLVLGSVSERLVKLARLPVLVARPKDLRGLQPTVTKPEPPRPGQTKADLHAPPTYELRSTMAFGARTSHISGNI